jgi:hypothetical protein
LLARAYNLLAHHSLLELCAARACFAKHVGVILRVDGLDGLAYEAVPNVVDNARD